MDCKEAGDMTLSRFFRENPRAALGFSGGVDSAYLLYAALTAGARGGYPPLLHQDRLPAPV